MPKLAAKLAKQGIREIPGYPGYYLDTDGNAYTDWLPGGPGQACRRRGKALKPLRGSKTKAGYVQLSFGRNERRYLHHLMLETFVGPRPDGAVACHLNDDPSDNRLVNLRWATQKKNLEDRRRNSHLNEGSNHGMSRLTEEQALMIRSLDGRLPRRLVGRLFGVSYQTVYEIQTGRAWRHLG